MTSPTVSTPAVFILRDVCVTRLYFLYCDYKQIVFSFFSFPYERSDEGNRLSPPPPLISREVERSLKMDLIHVLWLSKLPH